MWQKVFKIRINKFINKETLYLGETTNSHRLAWEAQLQALSNQEDADHSLELKVVYFASCPSVKQVNGTMLWLSKKLINVNAVLSM